MKNRRYLTLLFVAVASVLAPLHASALSVNDFEKMTAQQETAYYDQVVKEVVSEAYKVGNKTGNAVQAYFTTVPKGASETEGFTAFDAELRGALQDAKDNKVDLDKLQVEIIIADVVQTYVLPNIVQNTPPPAPKAP